MKQQALSMTGYFDKGKKTRREQFLAEMDSVVPWARLCTLIEPHYPKGSSAGGRPPLPLERMLRIYCVQQWYNLSDPGAEEALYDSITMRQFAGVRTDADVIPDETSILNFRRLLACRGCAPQWSIPSWWSSACGVMARCATRGSRRILRRCTRCLPWPMCSGCGGS